MRFPPWGDLLTAYNGTAISYDEIGNPDGYGDRTFTWEHGRQMATQTRNGVTWMYTYDANGMRTKRSSDSTTYEYVYSGDKLLQMTVTDHTTSPETVQLMEFSYDAAGQPLTFTIDGVTYYYVLNIQGDVMGMVDGDGNLLYTMVYEGYGAGYYFSGGSAAATMLLGTNPLGYRGYVMDSGTGLYYLQSRYYDPEVGRFLNADALVSTDQGFIGNNMFAYCGNNPINRGDPTGYAWWAVALKIIGGILLNAAINVGVTFLAAKVTGQNYTWWDVLWMALAGAANSIPKVGWLVDGIISGGYAAYTSYKNGASTEGVVATGVINGVCSMISIGNIAKYLGNALDKAAEIAVDVVFGSGNSLISAGISKGITEKNSTTGEDIQVPDGWRYAGRTPYNP